MNKKFILSEKIGEVADYNIEDVGKIHKAVAVQVFEIDDVKEFIRLLKENLSSAVVHQLINTDEEIAEESVHHIIDKLAGLKLIEETSCPICGSEKHTDGRCESDEWRKK